MRTGRRAAVARTSRPPASRRVVPRYECSRAGAPTDAPLLPSAASPSSSPSPATPASVPTCISPSTSRPSTVPLRGNHRTNVPGARLPPLYAATTSVHPRSFRAPVPVFLPTTCLPLCSCTTRVRRSRCVDQAAAVTRARACAPCLCAKSGGGRLFPARAPQPTRTRALAPLDGAARAVARRVGTRSSARHLPHFSQTRKQRMCEVCRTPN